MMAFYEDVEIGEERLLGAHEFTREAIIAFARQYDPQRFHIDEEAARDSIFGGLCASGWHVAAAAMRAIVDSRRAAALAQRAEPAAPLGVSPGIRQPALAQPDPPRRRRHLLQSRPRKARNQAPAMGSRHPAHLGRQPARARGDQHGEPRLRGAAVLAVPLNLRAALEGLRADGEDFCAATPEGWTQGRTLYGGMTAALSAQSAALASPGLPPLRSAQFTFLGPASGELRFRPGVLRQGRSATILGVDCIAEGKLAARGTLTYGAPRPSAIRHAERHKALPPPPGRCEAFMPAERQDVGFFQNFDLRLASGARPLSGPDAAPEFEVWLRHRDDSGVDPMVAMLALADGLPPAAMTQFSAFAPISTMTWGVDVLSAPKLGVWFLAQSMSESCADGYSFQAMELFDEAGVRVAAGRQTVAIFI